MRCYCVYAIVTKVQESASKGSSPKYLALWHAVTIWYTQHTVLKTNRPRTVGHFASCTEPILSWEYIKLRLAKKGCFIFNERHGWFGGPGWWFLANISLEKLLKQTIRDLLPADQPERRRFLLVMPRCRYSRHEKNLWFLCTENSSSVQNLPPWQGFSKKIWGSQVVCWRFPWFSKLNF